MRTAGKIALCMLLFLFTSSKCCRVAIKKLSETPVEGTVKHLGGGRPHMTSRLSSHNLQSPTGYSGYHFYFFSDVSDKF